MDKNGRDLRDLVFGDELARTPEAELQAINEHPERQEELNRLLQLREALLSLEDEEPPRRTVLVAPPVVANPWWKAVLGFTSPGWGFAGAMALAAAILAHGWLARPASEALVAKVPPASIASPVASGNSVDLADLNAHIDALLQQRLLGAVTDVKAELRQEHQKEAKQLVAAAEQRLQEQHDAEMFQMREAVTFIQKKYGRQMVANVAFIGEQQ
ncbi:MAG: hypothetical protein U5J83_00380 [Bryobacterales bacterium]|nr:hypothetical protein [Bryobacterales bacterium]